MEKRKRLQTFLGGTFAAACLSAAVMALPARADAAALTVSKVDYDNSTLTVTSSASDTTLYISDSKKKKWETCTNTFAGGECTIDISWVSTTKDYVLSLKGDKSTDIQQITIPKQNKKFKVKYDQANTKFNYTGYDGTSQIEYRKNNTTSWATMPSSGTGSDIDASVENLVRFLSENGNTLYFRVKGINGTNGSAGTRPSKEVTCKIGKKSAAPAVKLNTNNNTISVTAGWQVRRVASDSYNISNGFIKETSGYQVANTKYSVDTDMWYTYNAAREVPLTEIAPDAMQSSKTGTDVEKVILQFRKKASSSTAMSRITTICIPAQDVEPQGDCYDIQYTSPTTFKLVFQNASTTSPYEYCVVAEDDFKEITSGKYEITDEQNVTWKTSSSVTPIEIKKSEAPEKCRVFYRKKAIGSLGQDNFELATEYTCTAPIEYAKTTEAGTIHQVTAGSQTVIGNNGLYKAELIDGQCTKDNSQGYITFTLYSRYQQKVSEIYLSQTPGNKMDSSCKPEIVSSVVTNASPTDKDDKYIITTTIKQITLSESMKNALNTRDEIDIYAYIKLDSADSSGAADIVSDDTKGLKIVMSKKSEVQKPVSTDASNVTEVNRWFGATSSSGSNDQFENFWFNISYGGKSSEKASDVKEIKLGNIMLDKGTDYTVVNNNGIGKVTVNLDKIEIKEKAYTCFGAKKYLIITLDNGEVLSKDVTVKLIPPVTLDDVYAWAFMKGGLPDTEQTTTITGSNNQTITSTKYVNNYSASYSRTTGENNGNSVDTITFESAKVDGKNVVYGASSNKIEFSNNELKKLDSGSGKKVEIIFKVKYTNATEPIIFKISNGCSFSVL